MLLYHSDHRGKVARGSSIIALLQGRLLDVHLSLRSYREGC